MTDGERCRLGMIPEAMPMILIVSAPDDLTSFRLSSSNTGD